MERREDSKTYKIRRFEEVEQHDEYIEVELRQVQDFFRDGDNYKEPVIAPTFEGAYLWIIISRHIVQAGFAGTRPMRKVPRPCRWLI